MKTSAEIRLPDWLAATPLPPAPVSDEAAMRFAVEAARQNVARGTGGPFGAAVRSDASGAIVGVGVNLVTTSLNPVLHAETVAISLAAAHLRTGGTFTLFTSCEPCIMCLGAAHWAMVSKIVSAALKEDAEAIGFLEGAGTAQLRTEMESRGVVFHSGLLRQEAVAILKEYAARGMPIYSPKA
jgi:tRNA(Arg) A34 adenosine deaminase TadA